MGQIKLKWIYVQIALKCQNGYHSARMPPSKLKESTENIDVIS